MSIRKLQTICLNVPNNDYAVIYKDSDLREYCVKFYQMGGLHSTEADYYTDTLEDAQRTAKSQAWSSIN